MRSHRDEEVVEDPLSLCLPELGDAAEPDLALDLLQCEQREPSVGCDAQMLIIKPFVI